MGEINYFEVFDVTEETVSQTEPPSGNAPGYGGQDGSRDIPEAEHVAKEKGSVRLDESRGKPVKRGKRVQSDEENARFAARRRERERQEASSLRSPPKEPPVFPGEAQREATPDYAGTAPRDGVTVTGQNAFSQEARRLPQTPGGEAAQAQQQPESGGPAYEEQLQRLRRAEAEAKAERDYAVDRSIRQRIETEVMEIGRLDPSVRSFEDLRNSPDYSRLGELVRSGISLVDAYKLTHFDRLQSSAAESARQTALNAREGKAHLQHLGGTGGDTAPAVPGEVLQAYRAIMPDLSAREIERHYQQYLEQMT